MSTSWDDGFSPGDCGGITPGAPNVYAGTSVLAATAPLHVYYDYTVDLPVNGVYSLNIWVKWVRGSADVAHVLNSFIGFVDPTTRAIKTGLRLTNTGATPIVSDGTTTVTGSAILWSGVEEWHLWTISADAGWNNHTFYIDGDLQQTLNTAAVAGSVVGLFTPLVGLNTTDATTFDLGVSTDPGGSFPDSLTAPFTSTAFSHIPAVVGPYEIATQAALTADMNVNVKGRTVFARDNTITRVFWTKAENIVGWDDNPRHIIRGISDLSPTAAPITNGIDTVVLVPSITGIGGSGISLQAFDTYGQFEPATSYALIEEMRAQFGFIYDPFFGTAGNIPLRTL